LLWVDVTFPERLHIPYSEAKLSDEIWALVIGRYA
jgi:hypothetical protein